MALQIPSSVQIEEITRREQIDASNVVHEFYEMLALSLFSKSQLLSSSLVFKGGTALRLVYGFERYSNDLDFSLGRPVDEEKILAAAKKRLISAGFTITDAQKKYATLLLEVSYEKGSRKLKIEINMQTISEGIEQREIVRPVFPRVVSVQVYSLAALLAGKISACLTRARQVPRDIYDLYYLLQLTDYDEPYLELQLGALSKREVYEKLLAIIQSYDEQRIINELNPLLPKDKREFMRSKLKSSLEELLRVRLVRLGPAI